MGHSEASHLAGLPGAAAQYGPFAGAGMVAEHADHMASMGLRSLRPHEVSSACTPVCLSLTPCCITHPVTWPSQAAGMTRLHAPLAQISLSHTAAGVTSKLLYARIDAPLFTKIYSARGRWGLLDQLLLTSAHLQAPTPALPAAPAAPAAANVSSKPAMPLQQVVQAVKQTAADILGEQLGDSDSFPAGGFDSLSAVELASSLGRALELELPGTLVFDYPSVAGMAQHIHSLLEQAAGSSGEAPAAAVSSSTQPSGVPLEQVVQAVKQAAEDIIGEQLGDGDSFAASSLDSLSAVELASTLGRSLGLELPSTLVYDYPSVSAMAQHVHSLLAPTQPAGTSSAGALVPAAPAALVAASNAAPAGSMLISLAVAARLPTGYADRGGESVLGGADGISLVPYGRWDLEALRVSSRLPNTAIDGFCTAARDCTAGPRYLLQGSASNNTSMPPCCLFPPAQHGKSQLRARHAGFMDGIDQFDASLFGITGAEAELMDPQHRLLMEVRWDRRQLLTHCCFE